MAGEFSTRASDMLTNASWFYTGDVSTETTTAGINSSVDGGIFGDAPSPSKTLNAPYIIVSLIILVGNLLVIITILKRIDLQTPSNMYVFNLAVTDLMVGLAMVLKVAETYQPATFHSQYICISLRIGTIVHSMMLSVFVMAGIAVDRFMAINDPYSYQEKMTRCRTVMIIAVMWVYCFSISYLPPLLGFHNWTPDNPVCLLSKTFKKTVIYNLLGNFYAVTIMIYLMYAALFKIAAKHVKAIAALAPESRSPEQKKLTKNYKAAKTLLIVIGTFSACWLPYTTSLFYITVTDTVDPDTLVMKIHSVLVAFLVVNSAVNPMIYARRLPGFKNEFLRILTCYQYKRIGENSVGPMNGPT